MRFNLHSDLAGQHSFLSASKYHWLNYTDEKLDQAYLTAMAARKGTELHELASQLIRLGVKLPSRPATTLGLYVNDAIGYRMSPEQVLFFSSNAFGTADAISFRKNYLRIHDLKTGVSAVSEKQLEVYAALFCLEYRIKPVDIQIELRIYQNNEVAIFDADPNMITHIMDRFLVCNRRINELRMEELE